MRLELYADLVSVKARTTRTGNEIIVFGYAVRGQPRFVPLFAFYGTLNDYALEHLRRAATAHGVDLDGYLEGGMEEITRVISEALPTPTVLLVVEFPESGRFRHPEVLVTLPVPDEKEKTDAR